MITLRHVNIAAGLTLGLLVVSMRPVSNILLNFFLGGIIPVVDYALPPFVMVAFYLVLIIVSLSFAFGYRQPTQSDIRSRLGAIRRHPRPSYITEHKTAHLASVQPRERSPRRQYKPS